MWEDKRVEFPKYAYVATQTGPKMKSNQSRRKAKTFTGNSVVPRTTAPKASELELSLFGPGVGECLVIHLGSGEWMIVDSCLGEQRDKPIALEYLELLGVDVSSQVKVVLVTHWHDDHIRGVSDIVREASLARFACSAAVNSEAFFSLIGADRVIKLVGHTSGITEFAEVLSTYIPLLGVSQFSANISTPSLTLMPES